MRVAFGGITGGYPDSPYAYSWDSVSLAICPVLILATPSSQPRITWPAPSLNWNGRPRSRLESNLTPLVSVPT
uniref:Uncharacterized protein n=1 Tax=Hyaloperonospora arabidopsidis (strain Emoy2) TaxID=559515 RepID=M4BZY3_HYAAE